MLSEIKKWMIVDAVPCKMRQKLLRNLRVSDTRTSFVLLPSGSEEMGVLFFFLNFFFYKKKFIIFFFYNFFFFQSHIPTLLDLPVDVFS